MRSQHPVYEILAKEIAYALDTPKFDKLINNLLHSQGYVINRFFNDPTTGFQACGLLTIAPDKSPVIVFRGANRAIDDLVNNHPKGIGGVA